jgi:hypothetical protein
MDPDQFAQWASAAQSIVTSIGIIAGGLWVLFTFWNLRLMHRSRAEIAEIEQRAVEQPVLSLAIQSDTTQAVSGEKRFISVCALLRNDGRRALEFWAAVLYVCRLSEESGQLDAGAPIFGTQAQILNDKGKLELMSSRILRQGQARTVAFLVPPVVPGRYLLQLHASYRGLILKNGEFEDSPDLPIQGVEQVVVNVPAAAPREQALRNRNPRNERLQHAPMHRTGARGSSRGARRVALPLPPLAQVAKIRIKSSLALVAVTLQVIILIHLFSERMYYARHYGYTCRSYWRCFAEPREFQGWHYARA